MEATGRVIKRKCLTLETKQSIHRYLKKNWEVNGQNLGKMSVYPMVGEIFAAFNLIFFLNFFIYFCIIANIPGHFFNSEHSPHLFPMFSFKKHRSMHVCNHVTKETKINT
jgi:hypothetical protein